MASSFDPHKNTVVHHSGAPLDSASAVVVMFHGRGGSAADMSGLAYALMEQVADPESLAFLFPQAMGNVWYPQSGFLPQDQLQPWLDSALAMIDEIVDAVPDGTPVILGGFSQGAMLSLEYASRGRRKLAGVIAFSGSLIGPLEPEHAAPTGVDGLPIFIGCGTNDSWVELPFIETAACLFTEAGAVVDKRIYEGMDHRINDDEIAAAGALIASIQNGTKA